MSFVMTKGLERFKAKIEKRNAFEERLRTLEQRISLAHGLAYLPRLYKEHNIECDGETKLQVLLFEEGKLVGAALSRSPTVPAAAPQATITAVSPPAATVQSVLASLRALPLKPANLKARQQLVKDNLDVLLKADLTREQALLIFGAIGDNHDRAEFYLANKKNLI